MEQLTEQIREQLTGNAKTFKTSWVPVGQLLYTVWNDKLYHAWGFDKFEDYIIKQLGMQKNIAMKLVKVYCFVEEQEPAYLKKEFAEGREVNVVPDYEPLDALRLAKRNPSLTRAHYAEVRKLVFEGRPASAIRKAVRDIVVATNPVSPEVERQANHTAGVKRMERALKSFKGLKRFGLLDDDIIKEADELLKKLAEQYL